MSGSPTAAWFQLFWKQVDLHMPVRKGPRGPKRSLKSPIKACCAYKKCRRRVDVKNAGQLKQLARKNIDESMCRKLRGDCKMVKFCSIEHKNHCKAAKSTPTRGGREALTQTQCVKLFQTLVSFSPWAAMLSLLQLFIADRVDCSRQCQWGWLSGIEPGTKSQPMISIPKVNKKTVARKIPLFEPFARFLWATAHGQPLQSTSGETWPASKQTVGQDDMPLFPGYDTTGKQRCWERPVSAKAYSDKLTQACEILRAQRAISKS